MSAPAVVAPKDAEPRIMIVPAQLQSIVSFVLKQADEVVHYGTGKVFDEERIMKLAADKFLPDVTRFKDKIFVHLIIEMRGGDVNTYFLTNEDDWRLITHGTHPDAFNLGEIHGKHSEVKIGYSKDYWDVTIEKDPYEIARLVAEHGSGVPDWVEEYLEQFPEDDDEEISVVAE